MVHDHQNQPSTASQNRTEIRQADIWQPKILRLCINWRKTCAPWTVGPFGKTFVKSNCQIRFLLKKTTWFRNEVEGGIIGLQTARGVVQGYTWAIVSAITPVWAKLKYFGRCTAKSEMLTLRISARCSCYVYSRNALFNGDALLAITKVFVYETRSRRCSVTRLRSTKCPLVVPASEKNMIRHAVGCPLANDCICFQHPRAWNVSLARVANGH